MTDKEALKPRFHVEGQASTVGPRWLIWDGQDGHFARFQNIADEGDAYAICDMLNGLSRPTPPIPDDVVEAAAKAVSGALSRQCRSGAGQYSYEQDTGLTNVSMALDCRELAQAALTASGLLDKNKALVEALGQATGFAEKQARLWRRASDVFEVREYKGTADDCDKAAAQFRQALKQGSEI